MKNVGCFVFLITFSLMNSGIAAQSADTSLIRTHIETLTQAEESRNYYNRKGLDNAAAYIHSVFKTYTDSVHYQTFEASHNTFQNVIAVFGNPTGKTIVVGAHYDVYDEFPGADDNASAVAGLLEIARMLSSQTNLKYRFELVAYTLEEPPAFRTGAMGSYIHAKSLKDNNIDVYGMVCLEMIGYFSDEPGSQNYPLSFLKWIYGDKGDYIALVSRFGKGKFARRFTRNFAKSKKIKTAKATLPARVPGVDFSDHFNYWNFGYSALMITDTAFYRNGNYHQPTDTIETLDLERLGKVAEATFVALMKL